MWSIWKMVLALALALMIAPMYGFGQEIYKKNGLTITQINPPQGLNTSKFDTSYGFTALHFVDAQTGYLVGAKGAIFKTKDGGKTFQSLLSPVPINFKDVFFRSPQEGFAVGEGTNLLHTKDGGAHWTTEDLDPQQQWKGKQPSFIKVHVSNDGTWYVLGNLYNATTDQPLALLLQRKPGGAWLQLPYDGSNRVSDAIFLQDKAYLLTSESELLQHRYGVDDGWYSTLEGMLYTRMNAMTVSADKSWVLLVGNYTSMMQSYDNATTWKATLNEGGDTKTQLKEVAMVDDQTAVAVGTAGHILRTSNQGKNWNSVNANTNCDLHVVVFPSHKVGYAAGKCGTIISTQNGGQKWEALNPALKGDGRQWDKNNVTFCHLQFKSEQEGWVEGYHVESYTGEGDPWVNYTPLKLHTTNGGRSWEWVPQGDLEKKMDVSAYLDRSQFTKREFELKDGVKLKLRSSYNRKEWDLLKMSAQSGPWQWQSLNRSLQPIATANYSALSFCDENNGMATFQKSYYITHDGGKSWALGEPPWQEPGSFQLPYHFGCHVKDAQRYFAFGEGAFMIRSVDGGKVWYPVEVPINTNFSDMQFVNDSIGFLTGANSTFLRTDTKGDQWYAPGVATPLIDHTLYDIDHSPDGNILACGQYGFVYNKKKESTTWEKQRITRYPLTQIDHAGGKTWYAAGHNGALFRTDDDGMTWQQLDVFSSSTILNALSFMDAETGFVGDNEGSIYKTKDGGTTWQKVHESELQRKLNVSVVHDIVIDGENVYATGSHDFPGFAVHSFVLVSEDKGETWTKTIYTSPNSNWSIALHKDQFFFAGNNGIAKCAKDADLSKPKTRLPTSGMLRSIAFGEKGNGLAVGNKGTLLYTKDDGNTWESVLVTDRSMQLWQVHFVTGKSGWIVGDNGFVFEFSF